MATFSVGEGVKRRRLRLEDGDPFVLLRELLGGLQHRAGEELGPRLGSGVAAGLPDRGENLPGDPILEALRLRLVRAEDELVEPRLVDEPNLWGRRDPRRRN